MKNEAADYEILSVYLFGNLAQDEAKNYCTHVKTK
jgi:hypothetical protein